MIEGQEHFYTDWKASFHLKLSLPYASPASLGHVSGSIGFIDNISLKLSNELGDTTKYTDWPVIPGMRERDFGCLLGASIPTLPPRTAVLL